MFRRSVRSLALLVAAVAAALPIGSATAYSPPTALLGDGGPVTPLKNAAMIEQTKGGFRFIAGQQNSRITVTLNNGRLRFVDTGTRELRSLPKACNRQSAGKGIAAVCKVPSRYGPANPMFVEVWPRLGNDYVDGSALPAMTRLWVLADRGRDTVRGGAGNDFVNGAQDADRVSGGGGNDWLRTGTGGDSISGGPGRDKIVGADGGDSIRGGAGGDRLYGAGGSDTLRSGAGSDTAVCGAGADRALVDRADRTNGCERVTRS